MAWSIPNGTCLRSQDALGGRQGKREDSKQGVCTDPQEQSSWCQGWEDGMAHCSAPNPWGNKTLPSSCSWEHGSLFTNPLVTTGGFLFKMFVFYLREKQSSDDPGSLDSLGKAPTHPWTAQLKWQQTAQEHPLSQEWVQSSPAWFNLSTQRWKLHNLKSIMRSIPVFALCWVLLDHQGGFLVFFLCVSCDFYINSIITHWRTVPWRQKSGAGLDFNKKLTYFYEQNC